jgi:hypothetical protein
MGKKESPKRRLQNDQDVIPSSIIGNPFSGIQQGMDSRLRGMTIDEFNSSICKRLQN